MNVQFDVQSGPSVNHNRFVFINHQRAIFYLDRFTSPSKVKTSK